MMIRILLATVFFVILPAKTFADDCKDESVKVIATYEVQLLQAKPTEFRANAPFTFVLWRNGGQVAHQYRSAARHEVWEMTPNGRLHTVQYFDDYQRGIEYDPVEVKVSHSAREWELKYQLVSNDLLSRMQLESVAGVGCNVLETYSLETGDTQIALQWLPRQNLIAKYIEKSSAQQVRWELQDTDFDSGKLESTFSRLANYQTTDYSDIGDNESDPFLLKMMNLGFVSHGGGFYDAQGNAIGSMHIH